MPDGGLALERAFFRESALQIDEITRDLVDFRRQFSGVSTIHSRPGQNQSQGDVPGGVKDSF